MPISVSVSSLEWVRHVVFTGLLTDADVIAAHDRIARCLLDPGMDVLVDTSGVVGVAATPETLTDLASRRAREARHGGAVPARVAVVAPGAGVLRLARMYQGLRESASGAANYFVCRTIAEARNWLGLSSDLTAAPLLRHA